MSQDRPLSQEPIVQERPKRKPVTRAQQQRNMALFVLVVVALLVALPFYFLRAKEETYTLGTYTYAEVRVRDFRELVNAPGTIVPSQTVEVKAVAAGVVAEVLVREGDDVAAGQVLARLFSSELSRQYDQAKRDLAKAEGEAERTELDARLEEERLKTDITLAERDLRDRTAYAEKMRGLYELGAISKQDLKQADDAVIQAKADLDAKRAQLAGAKQKNALAIRNAEQQVQLAAENLRTVERTLDATTVTAPLDGRVLELAVGLNQSVSAGAKIGLIGDVKRPVVQAKVDAADIARVAVGQPVQIETPQGDFQGRVGEIAPQAQQGSGQNEGATVEVRIEFDQPPADLRPNTSAGLSIEVGRKDQVPYLPRGPYLTTGDGLYAFVIAGTDSGGGNSQAKEPGSAHRREVSFGLVDGDAVEVRKGLEVGERVIISSYEEFKTFPEIRLTPGGGRPR